VTENGTAGQDTAVEFLESHLGALQDAVDLGIDVRGFYYWSFVDNYEWNLGYSMEFGLLGYDLETKERISRPHFERYEEIIRNNAL
jgi:beta-glucosidase/6-phospho-beta-glucosidase/beta-galactosidase